MKKHRLPSSPLGRIAMCALPALFLGGAALHAQAWDSPSDGDFGTAANWSPASVPVSGDTAFFDLGSSGYTVTLGSDVSTGLEVDDDTLTLDLGGNTFTNEGTRWAGVDNAIDLTVTNGTLQSTQTNRLFRNSGASGTLTFTGSGTTWNTGTGGSVGGTALVREGTGNVDINNGATVNAQTGGGRFDLGSSSGSDGTLNIDGTGSKWDGTGTASSTGERLRLTAVSGAEATVNISNGGVLDHNGSIRTDGGDARATVTGTNSLLKTRSDLRISNATTNSGEEFLVQDGGRIEVDNQGGTSALMQDAGFAIEGAASTIEITGDHEFVRGDLRVLLSDAMAGNPALMTVGGDLVFTDNASGDNDLILELDSGFSASAGSVFDLIDFTGDRTGNGVFDNLADGDTITVDGFEFQADYGATTNDAFSLEVTAVPEPGHYAAAAGVLALLAVVGSRHRARS